MQKAPINRLGGETRIRQPPETLTHGFGGGVGHRRNHRNIKFLGVYFLDKVGVQWC